MEILNKDLKRRIIDISYRHKLSHIGSCLTAVDIIKAVYDQKDMDEKFVLSAGHAGLALYVVLEDIFKLTDAEYLLDNCGIHPDRPQAHGYIDCSTGSLGHGIGIAVGMALSNRLKKVYCVISDGECAEGSVYEALRIAEENKLDNLYVYVNWNGWAAYKDTSSYYMLKSDYKHIHFNVVFTGCDYIPFLSKLTGHYKVLNEEEYKLVMEILK